MSFSGSDGIKSNFSQSTNDLNKSFDKPASVKKSSKDNPPPAVPEADAAQVSVSARNAADTKSATNTESSQRREDVSSNTGANPEQAAVSTQDTKQSAQADSPPNPATQSSAQNAIDLIGEAATSVTALKGSYGAAQSRLESTDSTLQDQKVESKSVAEPIKDEEAATELSNKTAELIRQSSAVSALNTYKNISAQTVSKLLQ